MNKALVLGGLITAGAIGYIIFGRPGASQFGETGQGSKKDQNITEGLIPGQPVYNITFPDPSFPSAPQLDYLDILKETDMGGDTGGDVFNFSRTKKSTRKTEVIRAKKRGGFVGTRLSEKMPGMPQFGETKLEYLRRRTGATKKTVTQTGLIRSMGPVGVLFAGIEDIKKGG